MKKTSPIQLSNLFFTDYSWQKYANPSFSPEALDFDLRHDFILDQEFAGIAAELHFENTRYKTSEGTRRKVTLQLFDATDRVLLTSKQMTVRMKGTDILTRLFVSFPFDETEYVSGHAYRLLVRDDNSGALLGEGCFRTYGIGQYGNPTKWYEPLAGGVVPAGESEMQKSYDAASRDNKNFRIRFEVSNNIPAPRPDTFPELEVRIYYPNGANGANVMVDFIEPRYAYRGDFTYIVDYPFAALERYKGVCYVELLCMDHPIAGFVFSTETDIEGKWTGELLQPLDDYDYAAACRRYNESISDDTEDSEEITDKEYDDFLDAFIPADFKEADSSNESEEQDTADDSEESEEPYISENSLIFDDISELDNSDPIAELADLTGLQSVKEKIIAYDKVMRFCMLRASKGLELFHAPLHAMFLGSPGTGKTTVAKLMGKMLKRAGVLSSGHVVMKERSTLIGQYYSSEAEKTLEAIEKAQGGILFIDEAHSLFQPNDPKDPGKFVIEALLTALADPEKDDWMLILAGYSDGMKKLFDLNPGFKSRIPDTNIYTFEDYSEEELMEIAERRLDFLDFTLSPDAHAALRRRLATDYAQRDEKFGNARHVMNLIHTEILPAMAVRVMDAGLTDPHFLSEILPCDIPIAAPKSTTHRKSVGFSFSSAS